MIAERVNHLAQSPSLLEPITKRNRLMQKHFVTQARLGTRPSARVAVGLSRSRFLWNSLHSAELDAVRVWPYTLDMAVTAIKSTYSLDVESVRELEALASKWKVPKSEALRRAIRLAAGQENLDDSSKLAALGRLQASVRDRKVDLLRWARDSRTERHAGARRLHAEPE